jgi:putative hydrolase of the HAD superfamily
MIRALIFDLDDTLYRERDFVKSGYRAVAEYAAKTFGGDFDCMFSTMMKTFETQGRRAVLTVLREQYLDASIPLDMLVGIYRSHSPKIRLYPGYFELLQEFARDYRIGIITDGLPEVQERKVEALGLKMIVDRIIYTWEYGAEKEKPHPFSFSLMLDSLDTKPESALFIGDNPEKDCRGAHQAGMKYAQVQNPMEPGCMPWALVRESPEYIMDSLFKLRPILQELI